MQQSSWFGYLVAKRQRRGQPWLLRDNEEVISSNHQSHTSICVQLLHVDCIWPIRSQ